MPCIDYHFNLICIKISCTVAKDSVHGHPCTELLHNKAPFLPRDSSLPVSGTLTMHQAKSKVEYEFLVPIQEVAGQVSSNANNRIQGSELR